MLQNVHCLYTLVSHVVFPENMGPIANSKYPGIPNDKAKIVFF
jgi:hypothetical protein